MARPILFSTQYSLVPSPDFGSALPFAGSPFRNSNPGLSRTPAAAGIRGLAELERWREAEEVPGVIFAFREEIQDRHGASDQD